MSNAELRSVTQRRKLAALAGGAGLAASLLGGSTAAYADIIYHDNSSLSYVWPQIGSFHLTKGPLDQGSPDPSNALITQYGWLSNTGGGYSYLNTYLYGSGSATVASNGSIVAFNSGDLIGPSSFVGGFNGGLAAYHSFYYGVPNGGYADIGDGARQFGGVQYTDGGGATHYGWFDVLWNNGASRFDVYGWAYETNADTPIVAGKTKSDPVPEPGTLATLALGAAALVVLKRKRRRNNAEETE